MTDTSQKLREALQALEKRGTGFDSCPTRRLPQSDEAKQIDQWWLRYFMEADLSVRSLARQALALPTAAPDMPLSMNQFGRLVELTREHLTDNTFVYKATSKAGDTCHFGVESAAKAWAKGGTVEAIKVREFKLHTSGPTADHLPDAGEMIETAAPVGDLPELPEAYGYFDIRGSAADGYTADQMRAYARAALSAGDAVDAQRYRWLRDEAWAGYNKGKGFPHVFTIDGAGNRRTMLAEDALDASIDAAMRKGQL